MVWPAAIATIAGSLIGGVSARNRDKQNASNQREANEQNALLTREQMDWQKGENAKARKFTARQAGTDRRLQSRFAQNATGWAFDDLMESADSAGIHRLSALGGAQGAQFTPVGASASPGSAPGFVPNDPVQAPEGIGSSIGDGISQLGDFFSQQAEAKAAETRANQQDALSKTVATSEIDRNTAEAEMFRATSRTRLAEAERMVRTGGSPDVYYEEPNRGSRPVVAPADDPEGPETIHPRVKITGDDGVTVLEPNSENLIGLDEFPMLIAREINRALERAKAAREAKEAERIKEGKPKPPYVPRRFQ